MTDTQTLVPAHQLAETNKIHFPNESAAYRTARNALLVEEIELRRHIERVASRRRALLRVAKFPETSSLPPSKAPLNSSVSSATKALCWYTA